MFLQGKSVGDENDYDLSIARTQWYRSFAVPLWAVGTADLGRYGTPAPG